MPDPAQIMLLAHTGHWAIWVLYALPIIAVLGTIVLNARAERRKQMESSETDSDPPAGEGQADLGE